MENHNLDPFSKDLKDWDAFRYAQELVDTRCNIWVIGFQKAWNFYDDLSDFDTKNT